MNRSQRPTSGASATMIGLSVLILISIAVGITALRASVEGAQAGVTFGLFALAIGLASWWVSYAHTDPIADLIEFTAKAAAKAARLMRRLANDPAIRRYQAALATVESLTNEATARGQAAQAALSAAQFRAYGNNPHVLGHGPAASLPPGTRMKTNSASPDTATGSEG